MSGDEVRARIRSFQWDRGLRAAIAVGSAMLVCHMLNQPPAAAALGAFDALLVDNGGPYRTRLVTMALTLIAGAAAFILGALVPPNLALTLLATVAVAFVFIFARVLSQPIAASGVLILVLYFAGLGGTQHTLSGAVSAAGMILLGGAWAVLLSLFLWPVDPFRPARLAVALCYQSLSLSVGQTFEWQRRQRILMEAAREALAATAARAPSRTIRARNLTVLLETADLLLARSMRLVELTDVAANATDSAAASVRLDSIAQWITGAEAVVSQALLERPADRGAAFSHEGSQRVQWINRRRREIAARPSAAPDSLLGHILNEEREALLELETAFDAVAAIWTGTEVRRIALTAGAPQNFAAWDLVFIDSTWLDSIRAHWTMQSAMLRHALRVAIVGAVDVVVMRAIHINHGFWLPMTSIILLQPYSAGSARRSYQRVSGTIAGGILAAILAAAVPDQSWMIPIITALVSLTVATYAVDYALYCFFLTPSFVLLSLPHPHDWRYAGIRIGTTLAGALIAFGAMRLLWPERAEAELTNLLRRGADADAAYLRAMVRFWASPEPKKAEREILAPARRACGLASNDAEEAVDRVMQEPQLPGQLGALAPNELRLRNDALTFATYLRRLTQSITTLAVVGSDTPNSRSRLEYLANRMQRIADGKSSAPPESPAAQLALVNVAEEQMQRVERQVGILERAAASLQA